MQSLKIGSGFDVHQLVEHRDCIIGGIKIPFEKGLLGHSDADVLLHAIGDALLGAANLGDLGTHFSDKDPKWKNVSSSILLKHILFLLEEKNYLIQNIDSTVILQRPKIKPYIPQMKEKIAEVLGLSLEQISIKATTTEKLGFIGREEGVAAEAVVLIYQKS